VKARVSSTQLQSRGYPSVTVVVPTQERPLLLSRQLESLLALAYQSEQLDIIVVGGSDDPGREEVERITRSSAFLLNYCAVPDAVLGSASFKRNVGAELARGEILAFTDDDCTVDRNWVAAAVRYFTGSDVGGVEGAVHIPRPARPTPTYRGSLRLSLPGGYQTCNIFYRKAVFEQCGGFDLAFPYYLEDTDIAYSVMERGYRIVYASDAIVSHPVPTGRPLKAFVVARTVEQMPYLYFKHPQSLEGLKNSVRPFNKSHYVYLALYLVSLLILIGSPLLALEVLAIGLGILVPLQLVHDHWGLHVGLVELFLIALCQPIVPALRLFYWIKGLLVLHLRRWGPRLANG